jgi:hypothetical protein
LIVHEIERNRRVEFWRRRPSSQSKISASVEEFFELNDDFLNVSSSLNQSRGGDCESTAGGPDAEIRETGIAKVATDVKMSAHH